MSFRLPTVKWSEIDTLMLLLGLFLIGIIIGGSYSLYTTGGAVMSFIAPFIFLYMMCGGMLFIACLPKSQWKMIFTWFIAFMVIPIIDATDFNSCSTYNKIYNFLL